PQIKDILEDKDKEEMKEVGEMIKETKEGEENKEDLKESENKEDLNKQDNNSNKEEIKPSPPKMDYLQYMSIKYCLQNNIPFDKKYKIEFNQLKPEEKPKLIPFSFVRDEEDKDRLIRSSDIDTKSPDNLLFDFLKKEFFKPKKEDIIYFSPYREVNQYFCLDNVEGQHIYIQYPFLKKMINKMEHEGDPKEQEKIFDFKGDEETLDFNEIKRLKELSKFNKLLENKSNTDTVKVKLINGNIKNIPKVFLESLQNKLNKGEKIESKMEYTDSNGKQQNINPHILRQIIPNEFKEEKESLPYYLKEEKKNSFYYVTNLQKKEKEMLSKRRIEELILNFSPNRPQTVSINAILNTVNSMSGNSMADINNYRMTTENEEENTYNVDELKALLNDNNDFYSLIKFTDLFSKDFFILKGVAYKYVSMLCNNKDIPNIDHYEDYSFDVKDNLLKHFKIKNNPLILDDHLRDPKVTYTQYNSNDKIPTDLERIEIGKMLLVKENKINPENDLYEFINTPDIYKKNIILRKPFLRTKINQSASFENISVIDSAYNKRSIFVNELLLGDTVIKPVSSKKDDLYSSIESQTLVNIGENFIYKLIFEEAKKSLKNKDKNNFVLFVDGLTNKQSKIKYHHLNSKNSTEWVRIKDSLMQECLIYKPNLICLIQVSKAKKKNEYEIVDYYKNRRQILIDGVIRFLKDYENKEEVKPLSVNLHS
ncbi:MAG: hypothetical protein MJ252_12075, partial [archaeon]|nr:hypothetical protein [archaeon]